MLSLSDEQKAKILNASRLHLRLKHAAHRARVDEDELQELYNRDKDFRFEVLEARAIGLEEASVSMKEGNASALNNWMQLFAEPLDYLPAKERAQRVDADLFNDGAIIKFVDVVTKTVYDESKL